MNQITDTIDELELPSLTALDRCDSCGAQAYIRVTLASGDLLRADEPSDRLLRGEGLRRLEPV